MSIRWTSAFVLAMTTSALAIPPRAPTESESDVGPVLVKSAPAFRRCYERDPNATRGGTLVLVIEIATTGKVSAASFGAASTMIGDGVKYCIKALALQLLFPTRAKAMTVSTKLLYEPKKG